jgi:hypothetical protein
MGDQSESFCSLDEKDVKPMPNPVEGVSFQQSFLDFLILLARCKFAAQFQRRGSSVTDEGGGQGMG